MSKKDDNKIPNKVVVKKATTKKSSGQSVDAHNDKLLAKSKKRVAKMVDDFIDKGILPKGVTPPTEQPKSKSKRGEHLPKWGKDIPPPSSIEAAKNGQKGGIESGIARQEKKTARDIIDMIDLLPVQNIDKAQHKTALQLYGIPDEYLTQQTLRMFGLHKKAVSGDPAANKLLLEIKGEAPQQTARVELVTPEMVGDVKDMLDKLKQEDST